MLLLTRRHFHHFERRRRRRRRLDSAKRVTENEDLASRNGHTFTIAGQSVVSFSAFSIRRSSHRHFFLSPLWVDFSFHFIFFIFFSVVLFCVSLLFVFFLVLFFGLSSSPLPPLLPLPPPTPTSSFNVVLLACVCSSTIPFWSFSSCVVPLFHIHREDSSSLCRSISVCRCVGVSVCRCLGPCKCRLEVATSLHCVTAHYRAVTFEKIHVLFTFGCRQWPSGHVINSLLNRYDGKRLVPVQNQVDYIYGPPPSPTHPTSSHVMNADPVKQIVV